MKTMRHFRFGLVLLVLAVVAMSCNKDHYNVSNVHGVNAEGEMLLPLASGSYSLMDLMKHLQIDSLIECNASGDMSFGYFYERFGAVKGGDLLRFKDWSYQEHFVIENLKSGLSQRIDTIVRVSQTIAFESDHIRVLAAKIKSGHCEFSLTCNAGSFWEVVVTSPDLKDTEGHELRFVFQPQMGPASFSFEGMQYQTDEANALCLNYEYHLVVDELQVHELAIDAQVSVTDLALSEMRGYVDSYASCDHIDTVFSLFPANMSGNIKVEDALITLRGRNTFGLAARLAIDTALVWGENITPYDLFAPMPITIDMPSNLSYSEVYRQSFSGWIDAHSGYAMASSLFTVNPDGVNDMVAVYDTCNIDMRVDVSIPFSFKISDMKYSDTVNLRLNEIEKPEMIEALTLELAFNSTLPMKLGGTFMLYDSNTGRITDVLLDEAALIAASCDGQASVSTVEIAITDERMEHALQSDHLIFCIDLDTEAHDVSLNADQGLQFFAKTKVKYKGIVE